MPLSAEQEQELREIVTELEYRKRVNPLQFFNPLPLQKAFKDCPDKVKAVFGGNRGGKTECSADYVIEKCLAKPKQRWWLVAETFSKSVEIQQRKAWDLVPKNHIKYGKYDEINGFTNRKLLFDNKSLIIFKSYDQGVDAFSSDDVDGIGFDEEPPYDIYKESKMRLLDRNGEMIFSMTSTKGMTDLLHDIFEDYEVIKSEYAPLVQEQLPRVAEKDGIKFFFLWTTENPHIDQARVQQEARFMTREEIKSRIYGLPVNLSGKIYMAFNKNIHVLPFELAPYKDVTLYHVLDPHDRKPWAMAWFAMHKTGTGYCVDEYPNRDFNEMLFDDKTTDEYAKLIREKEEALREIYGVSVFKRIIDPNFGNATRKLAERQGGQSHTTVKEELRKRGLIFHDGIDVLEDGHLKVREMLYYAQKDGEIVTQPKFFITDNCHNTIKHVSRYSRKDINTADGDVKDNAKPMEKYKDFNDLIRYFWMANPKFMGKLKQFKPEERKVY
jgi:phage terminase large subunit-like protein